MCGVYIHDAQLLTVPFISQAGSSFCTLVLVGMVQSVRPACPPPSLLPGRAASLVGRQGLPCYTHKTQQRFSSGFSRNPGYSSDPGSGANLNPLSLPPSIRGPSRKQRGSLGFLPLLWSPPHREVQWRLLVQHGSMTISAHSPEVHLGVHNALICLCMWSWRSVNFNVDDV